MHETFKRLLPKAVGQQQWVVAVNVDIRGFTRSMSRDPAITALYLKKVYARILDGFFTEASFFKPTGDGLLLTIPFPREEDLRKVSTLVVNDAISLIGAFEDMVSGERMIPPPHPKELGIGLSAGSASRLYSGQKTLDYTGPPLNFATRLMDLARPSGIVLDATLDLSAWQRRSSSN